MLVILGLGNDLLGDDAVGLLAAERCRNRLGPDVAVRKSAQSGLYLLEQLEECDDAILLDSVTGEHPGRIRELDLGEMRPLIVPSAHYAGLPEVLAVARSAGIRVPTRLRILAVEIDGAQTIGSPPNAPVLSAVPDLVERAVRTAKEWGYSETRPEETCTSTA